jgi:hypothetical protein
MTRIQNRKSIVFKYHFILACNDLNTFESIWENKKKLVLLQSERLYKKENSLNINRRCKNVFLISVKALSSFLGWLKLYSCRMNRLDKKFPTFYRKHFHTNKNFQSYKMDKLKKLFIYIYMSIYMCVCVCPHIHGHTYT